MSDPVSIVDELLREAVRLGASDLYCIPDGQRVEVRLRVDGIQRGLREVEGETGKRCITRIKVLAGLLTYQTRVAQDGAIRDHEALGEQECRVSIMPTQFGERASLRFLQGTTGPLHLEDLGVSAETQATLRRILAIPAGMVLLTGPTGCGKTTTIYALVRELLRNRQDPASIISIEDPVECILPGVSQAAIREDWGYAAALKAALRQDVKTLVVGEMRDPDVVRVTLDAALTGHRVISTYHAGDIPSVYARMMHQGFEPFLIASAITGVVAQRLLESPDGTKRVPVMAVLEPDDAWREIVCNTKGLAGLRAGLSGHATADLLSLGKRAVAEGRLAESALAALG